MSFLWEVVKGMTPFEWLAGFALLVALIGFGAWRDSNRSPHRYRPAPPEDGEPPPDRAPRRTAHSH